MAVQSPHFMPNASFIYNFENLKEMYANFARGVEKTFSLSVKTRPSHETFHEKQYLERKENLLYRRTVMI